MRLVIAAIGKQRAGPQQDLSVDYRDRAAAIGRNIGFSGPDILEFEAPKSLSGAVRQRHEGDMLIGAAPAGASIFCLDERGKNVSSEEFATILGHQRDDGFSAAAFLIGGADGHDKPIRKRASHTLSFGAATWPHMLVRTMLMEQIYRAMTILSGHPYHRS